MLMGAWVWLQVMDNLWGATSAASTRLSEYGASARDALHATTAAAGACGVGAHRGLVYWLRCCTWMRLDCGRAHAEWGHLGTESCRTAWSADCSTFCVLHTSWRT